MLTSLFEPSAIPSANTKDDSLLQSAVSQTLHSLRETLHRRGRLSSRHEALDELSKLLFAHAVDISEGGRGISRSSDWGAKPAKSLREFVSSVFAQHLPTSLAHEFSLSEFTPRIRDAEDEYALEVIDSFEPIGTPAVAMKLRGAQGVDVLNDAFGRFLADSFTDEKELGQYLTPSEVVKVMVAMALESLSKDELDSISNPSTNSEIGTILDPSCGVGSFLAEMLRILHPLVVNQHGEDGARRWLDSMASNVLVGIDKSERMIRLALTNLAIFGSPYVNLHLENALARPSAALHPLSELEGTARLILTNPPFGAEFDPIDLPAYKIATQWTKSNLRKLDSEVLFLERYIDWLKPGGDLITILPDSVLTNKGIFADLRAGLAPLVELKHVVSLPQQTFAAAGTSTKTSILHLRKKPKPELHAQTVYFAVCKDVGYDVSTRNNQRTKISTNENDLPRVISDLTSGTTAYSFGREAQINLDSDRWDATYHASMPVELAQLLEEDRHSLLRLGQVAKVVNRRVNPKSNGLTETFSYVEISDINRQSASVEAKAVPRSEAPSRARKLVRRGDVLVSTVRPERGTVGVVPIHLDGAVCSTGIAVVECSEIHPLVLAAAIQTPFVIHQMLRNNMGIAYPVIDESCLTDLVLPLTQTEATALGELATEVEAAKLNLLAAQQRFKTKLDSSIEEGHRSI